MKLVNKPRRRRQVARAALTAKLWSVRWRARWDWRERIAREIAWKLPQWVCYWAAIRVMSLATSGRWGNSVPDETSIFDVLERVDPRKDWRHI